MFWCSLGFPLHLTADSDSTRPTVWDPPPEPSKMVQISSKHRLNKFTNKIMNKSLGLKTILRKTSGNSSEISAKILKNSEKF